MPARVWVRAGKVGVVERRGRHRVLPEGRHWLVPGLDTYVGVVDVGPQVLEVPPFVALDRDGAAVSLGLRLSWSVKDPVAATREITHVDTGLEQLAVATGRNLVGHTTLDEVLVASGALSEQLRDVLAEAGVRWGLAVAAVDVTALSRGPS